MNYYLIEMRNGPATTYLPRATSLDGAERFAQQIIDDATEEGGADTDLEDDVPALAWDNFKGDEHAWSQAAFAAAKSWRELDGGAFVAGFEGE